MALTITLAGCSFNVEPGARKGFWGRVARGEWEPETFDSFRRHITPETLFVDVGAWIGATALYGAQLARHCVAFEPDPVAFRQLSENLAANSGADWFDRITIHEAGVNRDGTSFVLGGSEAGADSMSSALFPTRASQWTVRAETLPDVLARHRAPGQPVFLKIDIEGGEYDLLPAVADILADPLVSAHLSFHPKLLRMSLAPRSQRELWQPPFLARHLQVLDCLPWSHRIALADGTQVSRQDLEQPLRKTFSFPIELVISAPGL